MRKTKDTMFYRSIAAIALPITIQSLITIGVNMMDTIMLGQLGEVAISASGLANQFIHIFHILCMGMGMGASVMTARYWGCHDIASIKKVLAIMYRLAGVFILVFTLSSALFPAAVMGMYTPDETVISEGGSYLLWSLPTYLLLAGSLTTTIILRSVGEVRVPLYSSIASFFVNIFFNWVFIFGHLGAPRMGVAGAALGTTLARLTEFIIIAGFFLLRDQRIRFRLQDLFGDTNGVLREYLKVSFPVLISDGLMAFGNSAISMIMGRIGTSFVSANAITMVTVQLSTVFIQSLSHAGCIITGQTLGAGDKEAAQQQGFKFLRIGLLVGLAGGVIITLISDPVISFYKVTPETIGITRELMRSVALIVVFQSANSVLTKGVLRGGGDTRYLMIVDVIFIWVASIPLGYLSGLVWHMDPFWIYFFLKIDNIIKLFICCYRLRSGKWIKRIKQFA